MGKMAEIKTKETDSSVEKFINSVTEEAKRNDSFVLLKLMQKISKEQPKMWGSSLIGFGKLRYKSPTSGREVEWFKIGFSPRKANISLYFMNLAIHESSLKKLGKHKAGAGCIYINKLEDIDTKILEKMIVTTLKEK
jgi:hypothetical protein